ncbi:MAG: hypothetical protein ACI81I_000102, partial [Arcobacteraceae bacterium]
QTFTTLSIPIPSVSFIYNEETNTNEITWATALDVPSNEVSISYKIDNTVNSTTNKKERNFELTKIYPGEHTFSAKLMYQEYESAWTTQTIEIKDKPLKILQIVAPSINIKEDSALKATISILNTEKTREDFRNHIEREDPYLYTGSYFDNVALSFKVKKYFNAAKMSVDTNNLVIVESEYSSLFGIEIENGEYVLINKEPLDYEKYKTITIKLKASNKYGTIIKDITINILPINEHIPSVFISDESESEAYRMVYVYDKDIGHKHLITLDEETSKIFTLTYITVGTYALNFKEDFTWTENNLEEGIKIKFTIIESPTGLEAILEQ